MTTKVQSAKLVKSTYNFALLSGIESLIKEGATDTQALDFFDAFTANKTELWHIIKLLLHVRDNKKTVTVEMKASVKSIQEDLNKFEVKEKAKAKRNRATGEIDMAWVNGYVSGAQFVLGHIKD